jgi:hypothetical protein
MGWKYLGKAFTDEARPTGIPVNPDIIEVYA